MENTNSKISKRKSPQEGFLVLEASGRMRKSQFSLHSRRSISRINASD